MQKTVNHILGATVALAMTATGAFAQIVPQPIDSLPAVITQPGSYYLTPQAVAKTLTDPGYAIEIAGSGISLDLRDLTVNSYSGIYIHNGHASDSGITVTSTPNGAAVINSVVPGGAPTGLYINGMISNVTVKGVTFTGLAQNNNWVGCNSRDNGSNDTIQFCTFQGYFAVGGDHETFMKNSVTLYGVGNSFYSGLPVFQSDGQANSFKQNTVASGNVQLLGTDTHQQNTLAVGTQINGGRQLGQTP
jgi:hypothetical protein